MNLTDARILRFRGYCAANLSLHEIAVAERVSLVRATRLFGQYADEAGAPLPKVGKAMAQTYRNKIDDLNDEIENLHSVIAKLRAEIAEMREAAFQSVLENQAVSVILKERDDAQAAARRLEAVCQQYGGLIMDRLEGESNGRSLSA